MSGWLIDWPNLTRYRGLDLHVSPPQPGERRVVFLGDSITDHWDLAHYFPGKPYINRGITAQTTPQMLIRFRPDVIALHPRVVVILAGTNDIAGNTGPMSLTDIENNYASIVQLAVANHIRVVIASLLPVHNYSPSAPPGFYRDRPMNKIRELNEWLKRYAQQNGHVYLDYFSSMLDDKGLLRRDLADDGLHPNRSGYLLMVPMVQKAINQAMASKR